MTLKKNVHGGVAVKSGTYTGNGAASKAIAGVGFKPTGGIISDETSGETCIFMSGGLNSVIRLMNFSKEALINSLDSDGFTVNNTNGVLNQNGNTYRYIAWS